MQAYVVGGCRVARRVWGAGALLVVLGGSISVAGAQASATSREGARYEAVLEETREPGSPARPIIAGRGKTTMTIGAVITSTEIEDISDDRITTILALAPRVAIGHNINDRFALEVPFGIQSIKPENGDRFTSIDLGVRPVVALTGAPGDGVRGLLTLMGRVSRLSADDESSNRFGYEVGAGPEFRINDALSFRGTFVYGSLAEDEDVGLPKETYYGLNLDLVHNLSAEGPIQSGGFMIRSGAAFTSISPDEGDGATSFQIPSPYLGLYFGVGESNRIRVGGEVEIARASFGDFSDTELTLLPTVEFDFAPADRVGFRLRGFGMLTHLSFDSGSTDESGTITGIGAGGALVLPMFNRYRGVIGLDYLKTQESDDLGIPSANMFRGTFGVELGF